MANRMFKGIALMGALFALNGFADECKGVALYSDGSDNGQMLETGRTFPEPPEWKTNWGYMDGMEPPYIRLSGMKNVRGDWKGLLSFPMLPLRVDGGNVRLKIRATQNVKFGVWLKGDFGISSVHYVDLPANTTRTLEVPLSSFGVAGGVSVSNVGVGLFQVPQYQYTTLFVDDVGFSCVKNGSGVSSSSSVGSSSSAASGDILLGYEFSNVEAWSEVRDARFLPNAESEFSAAYSQHERDSLISRTNENFLVSELEYLKIENTIHAAEMTAKKSRLTWYDNLYSVVRNRLRENVVANPKQLYFEAEAVAAQSDYTVIPLLVADLDYAYSACADSLCSISQIMNCLLYTSLVQEASYGLAQALCHFVYQRNQFEPLLLCLGGGFLLRLRRSANQFLV